MSDRRSKLSPWPVPAASTPSVPTICPSKDIVKSPTSRFASPKSAIFGEPLAYKKDVSWLHIAVNHARLVCMFESICNRHAHLGGFTTCRPIVPQPLGQCHAVNEVTDDIQKVINATDLVHADNVWMFQLRSRRASRIDFFSFRLHQ